MAGYDDRETIRKITATMLADPTLSRRRAILAVAGEGSLRRIEMKMRRDTLAGGSSAAMPDADPVKDPLPIMAISAMLILLLFDPALRLHALLVGTDFYSIYWFWASAAIVGGSVWRYRSRQGRKAGPG